MFAQWSCCERVCARAAAVASSRADSSPPISKADWSTTFPPVLFRDGDYRGSVLSGARQASTALLSLVLVFVIGVIEPLKAGVARIGDVIFRELQRSAEARNPHLLRAIEVTDPTNAV
jgi:hypothetical protein